MKQLLILLFTTSILTSCQQKETRTLLLKQGEMKFELSTPTAACKKCQNIMENGLLKIPGVKESILNLNTKKISIAYSPEYTDTIKLKSSIAQLTKQFPCK